MSECDHVEIRDSLTRLWLKVLPHSPCSEEEFADEMVVYGERKWRVSKGNSGEMKGIAEDLQ